MKFSPVVLATLSLVLAGNSVSAAPISGIVVFGDSLSDNGNAAYIFQNFPSFIPKGLPAPAPPLYTSGRYTNGPDVTPGTAHQGTWVEQLSAKLGLADPSPGLPNFLDSSLPPGNNLAVAGAETNDGSPVSIDSMVNAYISTQPAGLSSTQLYVVFGGANDLFRAPDPVTAATLAVSSVFHDVQLLHDAGARHFLVLDLPDLGSTPRARQTNTVATLSAASLQYSIAWAAALSDAKTRGIDVTGVDLYGLYRQIIAQPATYSLVNVTDPAQGLPYADDHLFWDILHPTTAGHALIANAAYDALNPVPEPATLVLTVGGIVMMAVWKQRKLIRLLLP